MTLINPNDAPPRPPGIPGGGPPVNAIVPVKKPSRWKRFIDSIGEAIGNTFANR